MKVGQNHRIAGWQTLKCRRDHSRGYRLRGGRHLSLAGRLLAMDRVGSTPTLRSKHSPSF